jgi:hypothetical protein
MVLVRRASSSGALVFSSASARLEMEASTVMPVGDFVNERRGGRQRELTTVRQRRSEPVTRTLAVRPVARLALMLSDGIVAQFPGRFGR